MKLSARHTVEHASLGAGNPLGAALEGSINLDILCTCSELAMNL